jgi:hypothetical protein
MTAGKRPVAKIRRLNPAGFLCFFWNLPFCPKF